MSGVDLNSVLEGGYDSGCSGEVKGDDEPILRVSDILLSCCNCNECTVDIDPE